VTALPRININAEPVIRIEQVTDEHVCVVVDDFLRDPGALVEFATRHADEFEIPGDSYPGLLFDVDEGAMTDILRFIRSRMSRQFSFLKGGIKASTYLSMATLQPDELSSLQRLCHTDPRERPDRRNYAGLIYLFENEELGGTGFYRWKQRDLIVEATAIEQEDSERALAFLKSHFPTYNQAPSYMAGSNEIAELLFEIPARFNRLVFYSGDLPHSASISRPELLSDDFSTGRLTLNCFASVRF